jgi:murein endopeptidase
MKLLALFALGSLHAPVAAVPPPSAAMSAVTMGFDPFAPDPADVAPAAKDPLRIVRVPDTSHSAGTAIRGRLLHGIQLPQNDALYSIRNPEHTWGSSHAIEQLQLAIASFRRSYGFSREIVIEDMSQQRGGRFPPHHSHRSGRDVDVELPLKDGVPVGTIPRQPSVVNWDATWALVQSFIGTGEVRYIFLSRSRQTELYRAAQRAGASEQELDEYIQYPHDGLNAFVRHSKGHDKHIHVRFKCASNEADCVD